MLIYLKLFTSKTRRTLVKLWKIPPNRACSRREAWLKQALGLTTHRDGACYEI